MYVGCALFSPNYATRRSLLRRFFCTKAEVHPITVHAFLLVDGNSNFFISSSSRGSVLLSAVVDLA